MNENYLAQEFGKSMNYTDIQNGLYKEYNVKKGLRNEDGTGVRIGLTKVSDVVGYKYEDGIKVPSEGSLLYRGVRITDIVNADRDITYGYEEVMFLLLFGFLPTKRELSDFKQMIGEMYNLPDDFLENNLLRRPGRNLMNTLQQAVLLLYNYDDDPDNVEVFPTLIKGLNIAAKFPAIMSYAYVSKLHYYDRKSLIIHYPKEEYSMAENILHFLRSDKKFSHQEAALLDTMLMIHADHGGGTNSTFTNVVVSSTGSDIYSTIAASIGSLKGPRHGGANVRVSSMMRKIIDDIGYTDNSDKIRDIVDKILDKEYYDRTGLIYGFGHAVYTLSDPRAELLRHYVQYVAKEKEREEEYNFYLLFEKVVKEAVKDRKDMDICANVDYYSGLAYDMLRIPTDLYTPLFVCARVIGWIAHNIENKLYDGRIMRPATKYVGDILQYMPINER